MIFFIRIFVAQGWYIGRFLGISSVHFVTNFKFSIAVAYSLGIYLLNLFLAFLQPKFDPSNEAIDNEMEDGAAGGLPTKQDEEFRPFIRRLPEFKFWYSATRAVAIGFVCTWFSIFDVPVFWPVLVVYWLILFALTSEWFREYCAKVGNANRFRSAETNPTHDQVPICAILIRESEVHQEQLLSALLGRNGEAQEELW
jgi:hypothetical protein